MKKKLWRLTVQYEVVVYAYTMDEALELADEIEEEPTMIEAEILDPWTALNNLPPEWHPSCIVYQNSREDVTVAEAIEECRAHTSPPPNLGQGPDYSAGRPLFQRGGSQPPLQRGAGQPPLQRGIQTTEEDE